jgi:hypothetical protein
MKLLARLVLVLPLGLALASRPVAAETTKATLAATRGEVTVNGAKPAGLPASVKVGGTVKPGANSGAMLIPVPGQTIFVDQNTEVQLKSCDMSAGPNSTWTRRSSCVLKAGHLHCSIARPKTGASYLDLITPQATLSAHGTSWATRVDGKETRAVVYAGVVTLHFGDANIDVYPGQVATITGEGAEAVLEVLDLKTGRLVRYKKGAPGQSELASAAQINVARDLLEQGFGAFHGTASEADLLSFSQIVAEINKVLLANSLAPINPPFEWQLWPDWYKLAPAVQPLASPEKPVN